MNPRLKSGAAVLPGAVLGVLGGDHLTRGFAFAARRMGYRVVVFSPEGDDPSGEVSDAEVVGRFEDPDAVRSFAGKVSVVTFTGDVPLSTMLAASERAPVRPDPVLFQSVQSRIGQRNFFQKLGLPGSPFRTIASLEELCRAILDLGAPAVLKTSKFGSAQVRVGSLAQAEESWEAIGKHEAVFESLVNFDRELTVIAARATDGSFACHPVLETERRNRVLDLISVPARISERETRDAVDITRAILEELNVAGVMSVEFFLAHDKLLVHRVIPGPHDAGYVTDDACLTSQFEQQLRGVCGLSLGSTDLLRPAAMATLLGDLWSSGEPDWRAACSFPEVKVHHYGAVVPRPGRRVGHLTAMASTPAEARRLVVAARGSLTG